MATKVLFILKYRDDPSKFYGVGLSSGLHVSAQMVHQMLLDNHITSHIVHVDNQDCVSREVDHYKPTLVILEDMWVTPEKLESLAKHYSKVTWATRLHSELPSISTVGSTVQWIKDYVRIPGVYVAFSS